MRNTHIVLMVHKLCLDMGNIDPRCESNRRSVMEREVRLHHYPACYSIEGSDLRRESCEGSCSAITRSISIAEWNRNEHYS